MRRWHNETKIMHRRWRAEMKQHGYDWRNPPTDRDACHCVRGIGSMRKRTPFGHHRHCLMCNGEKYLYKMRRKERASIQLEIDSHL